MGLGLSSCSILQAVRENKLVKNTNLGEAELTSNQEIRNETKNSSLNKNGKL